MLIEKEKRQSIPRRTFTPRRYDRTSTPLVAVLTRSRTAYLLVAVNRASPAAISAAVHAHYPLAEIEAWVEVGTLASGIVPELCAAFGLDNAEKLYEAR